MNEPLNLHRACCVLYVKSMQQMQYDDRCLLGAQQLVQVQGITNSEGLDYSLFLVVDGFRDVSLLLFSHETLSEPSRGESNGWNRWTHI